MIKKNRYSYLSGAIYAAYIGLFFDIPVSNAGLIILFITCIACLDPQQWKQALKGSREIQLLIGFYVLHVVGLLYTQNMETGLFVLEKKIALLLMPLLVFPAYSGMSVSEKSKVLVTLGIITMGTSLAFIVIALLKQSLYNYTLAFHQDYFPSIPYVYYAIYFAVFSLVLLNELSERSSRNIVILLLLVAYTLAILVLIASKTGLIAYVIGLTMFLALRVQSKKILFGSLTGVALCLSLFLWLHPSTLGRFTELKNNLSMLSEDKVSTNEQFTGLNLRLFFWKAAATQLWNDNRMLLGVGTGDAQDYLDQAYANRNLDRYGYLHFDPHNQWIETLLQLGLAGVALLATLFGKAALSALRQSNLNLLFFCWVILCFTFSESILESNKGIVFFALAFCVVAEKTGQRSTLSI